MGNLQTSDGGKGGQKAGQKTGARQKIRLLGGKKAAKTEEWTSIASESGEEVDKRLSSVSDTLQVGNEEGDASKAVSRWMSINV